MFVIDLLKSSWIYQVTGRVYITRCSTYRTFRYIGLILCKLLNHDYKDHALKFLLQRFSVINWLIYMELNENRIIWTLSRSSLGRGTQMLSGWKGLWDLQRKYIYNNQTDHTPCLTFLDCIPNWPKCNILFQMQYRRNYIAWNHVVKPNLYYYYVRYDRY